MHIDVDALSRRFVPWLIRHRRVVLAAACAATAVGTVYTVRLYGDLRSNIEELLPTTAPSVVAARDLGPKLHPVTHLSVALEGDDPDALERFADDLAPRLRALPPSLVSSVEYRIDEQRQFVEQYGLLYLSVGELQSIVKQVEARIAWERRQASIFLSILTPEDDPKPPIDLTAIDRKYGRASGVVGDFRNGYDQTADGHILALIIRPPEEVTGYAANRRLVDAVKAQVRELDPHRYDPTMRVGYDGEVASLIEEQEGLVQDLSVSTGVVLAFVTLALWLYYRRWTVIAAILGSLTVATTITFGLGDELIGYLNASSAFLGSIIVGNGINVSLIFAARYLEERTDGVDPAEAIRRGWADTLLATFVASFSAGLAYLALTATSFRGFNQFGLLGGLGMGFCWVCAYLLLPPLLWVIDARSPVAVVPRFARHVPTARLTRWVLSHGPLVRALTVSALVLSFLGCITYRGNVVEHDLTRLRTRSSMRRGTIFWGKKVDQIFQEYLTPIVIWAPTPEGLTRVVGDLDVRRRKLGDADPLREVRTAADLVPSDQGQKIQLIRRLQQLLPESRIRKLTPKQRSLVHRFLSAQPRPVRLADVPEFLKYPLTERDGTLGRVALAFPRTVGLLQPQELERITGLIRGAIADAHVPAQAVGQSLLFADIARSIIHDGPRATLLAFLVVCFLVGVVFRQWRPSLQVIGGLLLGVVWLVGFAALARQRLNFLNFVVPPITFGIGVDYSVNIIQRTRKEGAGLLPRVLRETGSAVALCSATTIIGYSSLVPADNQALAGFGLLASLGEVSCLSAALLALPAWLVVWPSLVPTWMRRVRAVWSRTLLRAVGRAQRGRP